jgi:uncharacterized membrane protein
LYYIAIRKSFCILFHKVFLSSFPSVVVIVMPAVQSSRGESVDEDEQKGGKKKQLEQKRMSNVIIFLGFFSIVFLCAMIKLKHSAARYTPRSLRNPAKHSEPGSKKVVYPSQSFLPPNSIYRLSIEDGKGHLTSLEKYTGMVTLVVNVASH